MNRLVEDGVGVIVISSDLPEVIGVSDRILVMHDLHFTGGLDKGEATQESCWRWRCNKNKTWEGLQC